MKRVTLLALTIAIALSFSNVFGAGVDLTGIGARAQGMGGNYRSIANDWSAMYWNPAGLSFTNGLGAGLSVEYVIPRATFEPGISYYGDLTNTKMPFSAAYRVERTAEPLNFIVPSAGITYNMGRFAFGIGAWAPFGLGSKWDILRTKSSNFQNVPGETYDTYNSRYPKYEYESDMQLIDIHPTISYKISDKLSVGAGASYVLGDISIRQPAFLMNPYLYNQDIYQACLAVSEGIQASFLSDMRQPPFDHLINQVEMKGTGTGFGANVGVMFKPTDKLSVGASFQYYTDVKLEGDYYQTVYFAEAPLYNSLAQVYSDSIFSKLYMLGQITDEEYLILSNFYSGAVLPMINTEAKADVPLPMKFGLGVSYSGFKNLLVAVDVNYTQWSAWDIIAINNTDGILVSELIQNWNDTIKIGVGFEYSAGNAKIRAGFSTENRASGDETIQPSIPDLNRRNNLNLGLSFPVGPVNLTVNYEKIFLGDHEVKTWSYDDRGVAENFAGKYTMNVNNLMIGIDYSY